MEGLPDELGACPPNVDPPLSAACLQHGRDAGITLQFRGVRPAIALRTKGSYQPRNESISSPWEGIEQVEIRVFLCQVRNHLIVDFHCVPHFAQHADETFGHQGKGFQHSQIFCCWNGRLDLLPSLFHLLKPTAAMLFEEVA
jgi:hypothetical protein